MQFTTGGYLWGDCVCVSVCTWQFYRSKGNVPHAKRSVSFKWNLHCFFLNKTFDAQTRSVQLHMKPWESAELSSNHGEGSPQFSQSPLLNENSNLPSCHLSEALCKLLFPLCPNKFVMMTTLLPLWLNELQVCLFEHGWGSGPTWHRDTEPAAHSWY